MQVKNIAEVRKFDKKPPHNTTAELLSIKNKRAAQGCTATKNCPEAIISLRTATKYQLDRAS